jgi:hypothetical protein
MGGRCLGVLCLSECKEYFGVKMVKIGAVLSEICAFWVKIAPAVF